MLIVLPGAVFTKGLSQVLGLTFVQKYNQLKPETWLRPFMNMAPGHTDLCNNVFKKSIHAFMCLQQQFKTRNV